MLRFLSRGGRGSHAAPWRSICAKADAEIILQIKQLLQAEFPSMKYACFAAAGFTLGK